MESVIAEAVVLKVCEMVVQQVASEVALLLNFEEDFEWLKNRIVQINCFLDEAVEERTRKKESVKNWLQSVRDIAWEAEDILEECALESMYGNITQSCALRCNQLILRHKMGRRIKKIRARLSPVIEEGKQLISIELPNAVVSGNEAATTSTSAQVKKSSLLPRDSHPVGIESKVQDMVGLLENPQVQVIAVVGMGGLGKTYLLQHVYDTTKSRFEICIWLSISQIYSVKNLQSDIASRIHLQSDENLKREQSEIVDGKVSEERAAEWICDRLQGKKCLIVLDDVWTASTEDNLIQRLGVPARNDCKIVVSTRNREVGINNNAVIYEMETLSNEDSWKLFCFHGFRDCEGNKPPQHLEQVAREIVEQCKNLPLAIKTIAASLASCTVLSKWDSKLRQLKQVGTGNDPVMDRLKLSYDSLPARLKQCFAYLSFFPEDKKIKCEYLLNLWIGEGFIPAGEEQWDMAWDCLDKLAKLCLVEVSEEYGRPRLKKYCKVHDLLLDLAINISKENKCAFDVEAAFTKFPSMDRRGAWCRILLAKKNIEDHTISQSRRVSPRLLRTLSLCENYEITNIPANFFTSMTVLRVLDLSGTGISTLPKCVGKMKLLKVLNLRGTEIEEVPKCVRHLKSLCFLNLPWGVRKLPAWISELKCLQHLEGCFVRVPKGISNLVSLRTLRSDPLMLSIEEDEFLRLENVANMTQLQELCLTAGDGEELRKLEEGILAQLVKMRCLSMTSYMTGGRDLPDKMTGMKDLERLELKRFAVPSWICCMANLRELILYECDCSNYPELQTLPNLVNLYLDGNWSCKELPKEFGKSGGFPQLRFLIIGVFRQLEKFPELEDGAMACLEEFHLVGCSSVKKVGEGLERLKRLKLFNYRDTGTDELRESLKEGGDYWTKIKANNPQVTVKCFYD